MQSDRPRDPFFATFPPIHPLRPARTPATDLLAGVSHEMRTPLNAILGLTGLLLDSPLSDEQSELTQTIRLSGETLLALVNQLLDVYRLEAGSGALVSEPFELLGCVEEALSLAGPLAIKKGLEIGCYFDPAIPPVILGDRARLRQVLLNLLSNAVKFTQQGAVEVWVTAGLPGNAAQPVLYFTVRDSGPGIPADQVAQLFRPFTRLSTCDPTPGTGLGLASAKNWVEEMGGEISVTSTPGMGTTFYFNLPFRTPECEGPVQLPALNHSVLLLEPNPALACLLSLQLQAWGMTTWAAGNEAEAIAALDGGARYDALLLADSPRHLTGSETSALIRHPGLADTRLVLMAPLGQTDRLMRRSQAEGAQVLYKPIKPSALLNTLRTVLEGPRWIIPTSGALPEPLSMSAPLRVLVAEDDPVNQRVALLMLQRLGHVGECVSGGRQALNACKTSPYDVLLIDLELPEMDGLAVARQVRRMMPIGGPRLIALTGHVSPGDRARCLQEGLDDYLAKPIDAPALRAALEKAARAAPVNRSRLEELMYAGGTDWRKNLVEIIEMFIQNADERLEQIDAAGKCGDWPRMTRLAHSLRSASAQLAADRLSTLAGQLEAAVTGLAIGAELAPETLALNAHLTAMRAEFRAVRIGLREIVGSM